MTDLIYIFLTIILLVGTLGLIVLCERLMENKK
jgi:hypothetical protein